MAVIGVRGRGGDHINGYIGRSNVQISYICDCDEKAGNDRCDQIEKRTGKRPVFVRDLREIMDKKDVDCVSIATPNHWHCLAAIWAMQSGKDVYVEKPVSYNIGEGCAITAAMKKYNKICQVGTQCRSSQGLIDMVKFIAEGGIGEVNFARGFCYKRRRSIGALGDYAIPDTVDFNLWSGPAPYTTPKVTRPQFHYDWHWQRL
ncbi:MAG: Gfo/Idh/MocA family oxidoreductase, partial [Thermoguttaceae bacterium]|nr:Gfo/Idh/MocA family oxidoreductase [Thermoguttaceae bacterium]